VSATFQRVSRWAILLLVLLFSASLFGEDLRFPAPEFKSGYNFPATTAPVATSQTREWIDVAVFAAALSLASWLAVKRRSRRGIFWLMIFSLLYFGFYKQGCVCPIGSTQNVALAIFNPNYAVPLTVTLFFALPLLFALFFGRVFCSSVCALGAIQDLVILKPIRLPRRVTVALSMIPYVYLGIAVLFAVVNSAFLICRFDPFIGFFRLSGNAPYLYLGAGFLLVGMFVARPYCRFFCPYGALLGIMSRFSRSHVAITPTNCVNCRLCEVSCPFDYIDKPNLEARRESQTTGVRRLGYLILMTPALMALGAFVGNQLAIPMSRANRTVWLAEQYLIEKANPPTKPSVEIEAFSGTGTSVEKLMADAQRVRTRMRWGGTALGAVLGLVFGLKLIGISTERKRVDYEINKASCFSCARCCSYCPNDAMHKRNFAPAPAVMAARVPEKEAEKRNGKSRAHSSLHGPCRWSRRLPANRRSSWRPLPPWPLMIRTPALNFGASRFSENLRSRRLRFLPMACCMFRRKALASPPSMSQRKLSFGMRRSSRQASRQGWWQAISGSADWMMAASSAATPRPARKFGKRRRTMVFTLRHCFAAIASI
jgi:polyferredoxin